MGDWVEAETPTSKLADPLLGLRRSKLAHLCGQYGSGRAVLGADLALLLLFVLELPGIPQEHTDPPVSFWLPILGTKMKGFPPWFPKWETKKKNRNRRLLIFLPQNEHWQKAAEMVKMDFLCP